MVRNTQGLTLDILTEADLAKRWRGKVSITTLGNWRRQGKGPAYFKPGDGKSSAVLYRLADVMAFEAMQSTIPGC